METLKQHLIEFQDDKETKLKRLGKKMMTQRSHSSDDKIWKTLISDAK